MNTQPAPLTPEELAHWQSELTSEHMAHIADLLPDYIYDVWDLLYRAVNDLARLSAERSAEQDSEIERMRDALEQIETIARNALTRPYAALRRIEELALEGLGEEAVPDES